METTKYRLPDGCIVPVDATAAKDAPTIGFELKRDASGERRIVTAIRADLAARLTNATIHITPTDYEKREWSRYAQAAYSAGYNAIGHRFSVAASAPSQATMPCGRFDALQGAYRGWLCYGTFTQADV